MNPASSGKDSTTGHWEIAGVHLDAPFPTYPSGFPPDVVHEFSRLTGRGDPPEKVIERLRKAEDEEPEGQALADYVVVNDDLETTIQELASIIERERLARS